MKRKWRRYLMPGLVFQSVLVGGGYGTGAEIAEYFGRQGLLGGLLGLGAAAVVWMVLCSVTFEFARVFRAYDYGALTRALLGPLAPLYDVCYAVMTLIVLGVVNATAASLAAGAAPPWVGVGLLSAGTALLVLWGTEAVERAMSFWSYVLYGVYVLFLLAVFLRFGDQITGELARGEIGPGWLSGGLRYAFYNLVCVSIVLYSVRDLRSRREAVVCGVLAGALGTAPAALLLLAMGCDLERAVGSATPVGVVFGLLEMPWLEALFKIVLFGTLIETGAGFVKAAADRLEGRMPRAASAALTTAAGVLASTWGLSALVARGYGSMCWGVLLLYVLPMMTVGLRKIGDRRGAGGTVPPAGGPGGRAPWKRPRGRINPPGPAHTEGAPELRRTQKPKRRRT